MPRSGQLNLNGVRISGEAIQDKVMRTRHETR
jgi:hypothetical protein